jgi:hypothetical protein
MSEMGISDEESSVRRAEQATTEGSRLLPEAEPSKPFEIQPEQITEEYIRRIGFNKTSDYAVQDGGADIVEANDRLFNLAEEIGWQNVFEALFFDPQTAQLRLGIFVRQGLIPDRPDSN